MHYDKNDLILLYNGQNMKDRQTLAFAYTITGQVNKQEVNSVRLSETLFSLMIGKLNISGKDIVNKADPYYQENCRGKELDAHDWHAIVTKRPSLLQSPIAMYRGKAVVCRTPTDILRITA